MNKKDLLDKIKSLEGLNNEERAYLVNLVNTKKKYGLVWEDKPEEVEEQLRTKLPILKEVKERAIINDTETEKYPNHILIEGDNLHTLTALTFTHENKIDLIYIDPPYNTGNQDFLYNDKYIDTEDSYRHSKWLSFMDKRLRISKNLISETGVIFISIDDNELTQLKLLCDEIFGQNNCENIFTIKVRHENRILRRDIRYHQTTEYLLAYRKTNSFTPPRRKNQREADLDYKYNIIEKEAPYQTQNINGYKVEIFKPEHYEVVEVAPGEGQFKNYSIRGSLITQSGSASEYYEKNLRERKKSDGFSTLYKVIGMGTRGDGLGYRYIAQPPNATTRNGSYFQGRPISKKKDDSLPYPNYYDFVNEFNNVGYEGGVEFKNGKKPLDFLAHVFSLANIPKNAIVLDFFAGSGSTLHALLKYNQTNKEKCQGIIVTNNENNIAEEITYKRISNVLNGYSDSRNSNFVEPIKENNLRYFKSLYVNREPSLANKRQLTQLATELLCIKEDCYQEVKHKMAFTKREAQIFTNGKGKYLVAVYHSRNQIAVQEQLIEWISTVEDATEKIRLYAFSPEKETLVEEFIEVEDKIEAVPLPEAIYNAYLSTIKTLKVDKKNYELNTADEAETQNN